VGKALVMMLALVCPFLAGGCGPNQIEIVFAAPQAAVDVIYDDDCDGDYDCAVTQPVIHHWIDMGYVKVWGMVSSAPSKLGAPAMKVFQKYYGHDGLFPIGAWTPGCGAHDSAGWAAAMVGQLDAGDVCTNYTDCATVLRQSVAKYIAGGGKARGLAYVITGPLTCEEAFRGTAGDAISPLSGAQMEQQYIQQFVVMNGCANTGSRFACTTELNCWEDLHACSSFFGNVTSQNGYPNVYVVPLNTGAENLITRVPVASLPLTNPTAVAFRAAGATQSADEDVLAVEFAVYGGDGWSVSQDSSDTVSVVTAQNSWTSSAASGQYSLTITGSSASFAAILTPPWVAP
jgi:hypothetical protein